MNPLALADTIDDELAQNVLRTHGPLVDVKLYFEDEEGNYLPPVEGKALVDTGADRTAVEFRAAEVAGAKPVGFFTGQGATSEAVSMPMYGVKIGFPGTQTEVALIAAGTPHLTSQGIVALIGRDVLSQSHLSYNGPKGEFALFAPRGKVEVKPTGKYVGVTLVAGVALGIAAFLLLRTRPECETG